MRAILPKNIAPKNLQNQEKCLSLISCLTNYMPNNQFKKENYTALSQAKHPLPLPRRLQKKFNQCRLESTIEQWSVLYHLWKQDGMSQQELCNATFRDKPSITRLVDNLEKLKLVKRVASKNDRRINLIYLTKTCAETAGTNHGTGRRNIE